MTIKKGDFMGFGGAKGKYHKWLDNEGLILLEGWARAGLTDEQIARNMGISPVTLYDYKNKYPKISNALKKGKEVVDYAVENALLKQAIGGNVTAQIFWLKNRMRDKWSDVKNIEHSGEIKNPMEKMTDEELRQLAKLVDFNDKS